MALRVGVAWRGRLLVWLLSFTGGFQADLVTLEEQDQADKGLDDFLQKNLEPFGVACVAYVGQNSKNHELIQKFNKEAKDNRSDFHYLQLPTAAALHQNGIGEDRLTLKYRRPFADLWKMLEQTVPGDDLVFPHTGMKPWSLKVVRAWMLENAWPLINIRITDKKLGPFPEAKYMSPESNKGGVVIIASNLMGEREVKSQFQISKILRRHAEKYAGKLRFTFVERTKSTREFRRRFSVGIDLRHQDELLLIENVKDLNPSDRDTWNHFHGNPRKYRLRNLTQGNVDSFFDLYERKALPTFWASKEEWTFTSTRKPPKGIATRLTGDNFESLVYDIDPEHSKLVAFFNDDPADGCSDCSEFRMVWDRVAKKVQSSGSVRLMTIDQSLNEHPETKVPAKLAQALVVFYPPGTRKNRIKKRMVFVLPRSQDPDQLVEFIGNKLEELTDGDDEEL